MLLTRISLMSWSPELSNRHYRHPVARLGRGPDPSTIPKTALKQRWAQQFPNDNDTPPLPQPDRHILNTPTTRQTSKVLDALHKLGAIRHDRHHITITDPAVLI
jgi:hypothetical protein